MNYHVEDDSLILNGGKLEPMSALSLTKVKSNKIPTK